MKGPADTHVISKSYRTGLIIKCGILFTVGLILTGVILYFSAHQPLGPSYQESFARLSQLKREMLIKSIIIYFTLSTLTVAGVIFTTLLYSHRVVGPMVGLKRIIGLVKDGDYTVSAHLREKDAIKPMAEALNSFIASYRDTIKTLREKTIEMNTIIDQLEESDQINNLTAKAEEIQLVISTLKLRNE